MLTILLSLFYRLMKHLIFTSLSDAFLLAITSDWKAYKRIVWAAILETEYLNNLPQ